MNTIDFEQRLLKEKKGLENFSFSLTQNREEAKNLVQDTFLKALMHKESFKEDTNIKAWLFTIMKNTFINNYRKNKRVGRVIEDENAISYINRNAGVSAFTADHDLNYENIKAKIKLLPKEQRIPFEMINQGYKYQEIADRFSISIGTVKSRIFLARKKLMDNLDKGE